jgi:hypothetical protein
MDRRTGTNWVIDPGKVTGRNLPYQLLTSLRTRAILDAGAFKNGCVVTPFKEGRSID